MAGEKAPRTFSIEELPGHLVGEVLTSGRLAAAISPGSRSRGHLAACGAEATTRARGRRVGVEAEEGCGARGRMKQRRGSAASDGEGGAGGGRGGPERWPTEEADERRPADEEDAQSSRGRKQREREWMGRWERGRGYGKKK
ncbi:unnamed protein product [Urochloa humidicola]